MNLCRTCLRTRNSQQDNDLFASKEIPTKLQDVMHTIGLFVSDNDNRMPDRLCTECLSQLEDIWVFCEQAAAAETFHRRNVAVQQAVHGKTLTLTIEMMNESPQLPNVVEPTLADHDNRINSNDENDVLSLQIESANVVSAQADCIPPDSNNCLIDVSDSKNTHDDSKLAPFLAKPAKRIGRPPTDRSVQYTCDMCGHLFYDKNHLAGHLRSVHCGLPAYPCDHCPRTFDKYYRLVEHQIRHQSDQPTACPHLGCGKTYRLPQLARDHYERIHLGRKERTRHDDCICDECGRAFRTRSNLQQHKRSHMPVAEYPFECEVCGKRFLAKNGHRLHVLRHLGVREFACPLCPARMVSQLELKAHVANHDRSVEWPCGECAMVYQRKASLRQHELAIHRNLRPFVCTFCGRGFNKKLSWVNHERLHTGERPFECTHCDRRFVRQSLLNSHLKTHANYS